jgi:hypothetical protein
LFHREGIERVEIDRRRFLWSKVRLMEDGRLWAVTMADPRQVEAYARCLSEHFGATKSGYWPRPQ